MAGRYCDRRCSGPWGFKVTDLVVSSIIKPAAWLLRFEVRQDGGAYVMELLIVAGPEPPRIYLSPKIHSSSFFHCQKQEEPPVLWCIIRNSVILLPSFSSAPQTFTTTCVRPRPHPIRRECRASSDTRSQPWANSIREAKMCCQAAHQAVPQFTAGGFFHRLQRPMQPPIPHLLGPSRRERCRRCTKPAGGPSFYSLAQRVFVTNQESTTPRRTQHRELPMTVSVHEHWRGIDDVMAISGSLSLGLLSDLPKRWFLLGSFPCLLALDHCANRRLATQHRRFYDAARFT